jgi:hypothetical protein
VANRLKLFRSGAVGFIDWLDVMGGVSLAVVSRPSSPNRVADQKHATRNVIGAGHEILVYRVKYSFV